MKPQHRTPTKSHKSVEACKNRALKRFMAGGRESRRQFMEQFRGSTPDDQRQIIKDLIRSPGDLELSNGPGIDLDCSNYRNLSYNGSEWDWEDDHNYTDFLIQLDETIAAELHDEECYYPDDIIENEMGYYGDDIEENDDANENILCPVCWHSFLSLDESSNSLVCVCGTGISLSHINAQEVKTRLSAVYDRHYGYCKSYCQSVGLDSSREGGLKCEMHNGGLLALCSICGFREGVL